ncbi:MAG: hypothetical protein C0592_01245 [Marinilabiliales bacterium]|nr:MAG: hypothetical protein C0592_01245 [Marinilabiliales bacterium]
MQSVHWHIPWIQYDSTSCFEIYMHSLDEVPAVFCNPSDTTGDSLLIKQVSSGTIEYSESILKTEPVTEIKMQKTGNQSETWPFFVISISLVLLGVSLVFSFNRFRQGIKAAFSFRETGIFIRNFTLRNSISTIITYINTYVLLALIIILFAELNLNAEPKLFNFILIFGGLIIYQITKNILIYLSEKLFSTGHETEFYSYRDYFTKSIGSTFALPFVFASFYSPFHVFFLYIAALIFAYSFVHQFVLAIITGYSESRYSFFYFILYFCSVEILPLLVGAKVLIDSGLMIW